jgi:high-affinity nickel-transport protein
VGAFGIAKYFFPVVAERSEGRELMFGLVVVAIVAFSFLVAVRLAKRPAAQESASWAPEQS